MTGVPLAPCHDEFRGPRSDYVRQVALETTTINLQNFSEALLAEISRAYFNPPPNAGIISLRKKVKPYLCRQMSTLMPKSASSPNHLFPVFSSIHIFRDRVNLHTISRSRWTARNYTMAFGDGPRNSEPWSSDVDDT
ncbi:hypothetical protein TNCV_3186351 [Trichonephila clavipes]|nr:hypothetical protein TNCV_3186351 [Trichonephila clavipes]